MPIVAGGTLQPHAVCALKTFPTQQVYRKLTTWQEQDRLAGSKAKIKIMLKFIILYFSKLGAIPQGILVFEFDTVGVLLIPDERRSI